ncbi:type II secretion system F family protein [Companilactobacillus zhongbaensis]|uniref:type II secretion system F family protein n=1 Tax=Companilactobacillus zhongbaensis TaxID=2486009 RepID=UPI000F79377C|nr:type II secretion system F family protein [Companilactobacillus zhongbaensis]
MKFTMNLSLGNRVTSRFQADYLLLISKLMKNGFSLNQAMRCLKFLDQDNQIYQKIYSDLEEGYMLSTSMKHLQLPLVVQNQLVISQMNGGLQQTVEQCGHILKQKAQQQAKLKEILAYPAFIIGFLSVMVVGMKVYILPQIQSNTTNSSLDLFIHGLTIIAVLLIITGAGFVWYLRRQNEYQRAQILIKLPLLKTSYLNFYQFTILQGLGMQFSQGLDLQKICLNNQNFVDGSIQNVIANKLLGCLKSGDSLQEVIQQEPLLPNELNMIFNIGNGGAEVGSDLLLLSELKYQATQTAIKKLINLVQPALFGLIAVFILIAYLMILLPVYSMMKGMN